MVRRPPRPAEEEGVRDYLIFGFLAIIYFQNIEVVTVVVVARCLVCSGKIEATPLDPGNIELSKIATTGYTFRV